jgi:hypothetical protein
MNLSLGLAKRATDTSILAGTSIGAAVGHMLGAIKNRVRDQRRDGVMLAETVRAEVVEFLTNHPEGATADEIATQIRRTFLTVRPRCSELARASLIKDSLSRRPNASGKNAIVWVVV